MSSSTETPSDLKQSLQKADLLDIFENLSPSHKKEYLKWINEAKMDGTRQNRIKKAIEMIKEKLRP